ncbi:hypothetical protein FRC09_005200 [Ceratobasidium sp. 395]|nr:hypothetical protein FRC09_005200 [Ceratobasidium sp. 395]
MSEADSSEFNPSTPNFSNIHALIIGVNKYISSVHHDLGGCVSDAKAVRALLTDRFGVPEENIECLFDEQATRKGILGAFRKHLIQNEKIQPGDPILVYFSGHGDHQVAPAEWHASEGMTELILPHDVGWDEGLSTNSNITPSNSQLESNNRDVDANASRSDPNKDYKHGIPDRTLAALLYQLSKAKGDNIVSSVRRKTTPKECWTEAFHKTVILDCCHSGSGTRGQCRARFSNDPAVPSIPCDIDEEDRGHFPTQGPLSQTGSITATKEDFGKFKAPSQAPSLKTHVLLAACKNDEVAQEFPDKNEVDEKGEPRYRGLFTIALIAELEGCDPATTSYSALMRGVQKRLSAMFMSNGPGPSPSVRIQSPQCEGRKQDRLLFRTQFAFTKGMIQLDRDRWPGKFRIKAGSASGIQSGTQLGVYSSNMSDGSPPVAQLEVTRVTDTEAWLSTKADDPNPEIPQNAYVVVTKYTGHSVRMLVEDQLKTSSTWQEVFAKLQSQPIDIVWSKPGEPSDLVLKPKGEDVVLVRQDPSIIQLEPRDIELKYRLGTNELARKLSSIAHFHFHLQRRNTNSPLQDKVGMKLIELKAKPGRAWSREYAPIKEDPEDLFGGNLSNGVVVQLQAAPDKRYGLQLTNGSNWPLFAWVVYFDLEDYSITFLYNPPARNANPPLSTNGKELAIGYGDASVEPLRVENSGYSERESGIFMLFVSQKWVDIAHMEQDSIFSQMSADKGDRADVGQTVSPDSSVWDVFVVEVVIN